MKVTILFRDGKRRTYDVKIRRGMTIEDIAREVAEQMCDEFERAGFEVKDRERWIEANMRWLAAHLYEAILDKVM